ncbi:diguanylate cyclase (GGDEF)-like protein [Catenuloplanes nepalensis]|uniref:Diguanylate cyclase (GGDEF)-like protein n=1 Tax=Catenuloplanes nepalensis TaxID=587533 RepID=A0ABT9MWX2_9ACTN|nr:bifunctional diguanylate cyclase/phosphodiesterase [Catenuloplanes nepalensis]MDP9795928.1 diguanylate cyclase (GGDEF)-like protein [Catenuloplanes nepalensis]
MWQPDETADLVRLAHAWTRAIAAATFVPGPRRRTLDLLESFTVRLADALDDEPFDADAGYRVGEELADARLAGPAVLGETIAVLTPGLLARTGTPSRVGVLLGRLATGFTETVRERDAEATETLRRALEATRRREEAGIQRRLTNTLLYDPLTGLPNRSKLLDGLGAVLGNALPGERVGLCLLDVDRFTAVTDTMGHERGDDLLRLIAQKLRAVAHRHRYYLHHLGSDRFAAVITGTAGPNDLIKAADLLLRAFPDPFVVDGHSMPITGRAGIAETTAAGATPESLLRSAAIALGWARHDDAGPIAVFDPDRSRLDIRRHELAAAMPGALDDGQFVLHYQPLVDLLDHRTVGVEALARWRLPATGLLQPAEFVHLAERTGLIRPLGAHLLEAACARGAEWHPSGVFVSVNLSPVQLADPALVATVAAALDRTGLLPSRLQLELTGSAAPSGSAALSGHRDTLRGLADLGVRLAVDDFGAGSAGLADLAELPISAVKLAPRFLSDLVPGPAGEAGRVEHRTPPGQTLISTPRDRVTRDSWPRDPEQRDPAPPGTTPAGTAPHDSTLLAGVIRLCHDLGITVTAVGVETDAQATALRRLACDLGQGFRFARPAPASDITRLLG